MSSLLGDLTSWIDSKKRIAADRVSTLLSDPATLATRAVSDVEQQYQPLIDAAMQGDTAGILNTGLFGPQQTLWHGSPYLFNKFDARKIGSGEGGQAQGYGHYLSEAKFRAQDYVVDAPNVVTGEVRPTLYKVDFPDADVEKMIDYEKPLNQQSEYVKKTLEKAGITSSPSWPEGGRSIVQGPLAGVFAKQAGFSPDQRGIAEWLSSIGIKGFKYRERMNRENIDAIRKEGVMNYVVFPGNEDLLKILERQ